jgi:hypothetical protein
LAETVSELEKVDPFDNRFPPELFLPEEIRTTRPFSSEVSLLVSAKKLSRYAHENETA